MRDGLSSARRYPLSRLELDDYDRTFVLRPLEMADASRLYLAVERSRRDLEAYMPWVHEVRRVDDCIERIRRAKIQYLEGNAFEMGLFDEDTSQLLSCIALEQVSPNPSCLELSFWTPSELRGQGFATCAARLGAVMGLEYLSVVRVQLSHDKKNLASQRIASKCGFIEEGRLRNLTRVAPQRPPGYQASGVGIMYSLIPGDLARLGWYAQIANIVRAYTMAGELIEAEDIRETIER